MKIKSKMQFVIWGALYFIVYVFLVEMQRRYFANLEQILGEAFGFVIPAVTILIVDLLERFIYRKDPFTGDKYLKKCFRINRQL